MLDEEWATFRVLLADDTFTRNGDAVYVPDAFLPSPTGYSLEGDRAVRNTGWGIYAPRRGPRRQRRLRRRQRAAVRRRGLLTAVLRRLVDRRLSLAAG